MTTRATYLATAAILASGAVAAPSAQAAYMVNFEEVGSNVVETGGGTIDPTGLRSEGSGGVAVAQLDSLGFFMSGTTGTPLDFLINLRGPTSLGPGVHVVASSSSGDGIGLSALEGGLFIPTGYVSGSQLSETSTYLDATFASLGLTPGAYVFRWGVDDPLQIVHREHRRTESGPGTFDLGDDAARLRRPWLRRLSSIPAPGFNLSNRRIAIYSRSGRAKPGCVRVIVSGNPTTRT
jgi:hypothetical protein